MLRVFVYFNMQDSVCTQRQTQLQLRCPNPCTVQKKEQFTFSFLITLHSTKHSRILRFLVKVCYWYKGPGGPAGLPSSDAQLTARQCV